MKKVMDSLDVKDVRLREVSDEPEATRFFDDGELAHKVGFGPCDHVEHHSIDKDSRKQRYIQEQKAVKPTKDRNRSR